MSDFILEVLIFLEHEIFDLRLLDQELFHEVYRGVERLELEI
jgi:hypothetical protein